MVNVCTSCPSRVNDSKVHLNLIELTLWILVETADPDISDAPASQNVIP